MPCCGEPSSDYSNIQSIKDVPDDAEVYVLTINQNLPYLPSKVYKSSVSNITYRTRSKEDVIEILDGDLAKLLGQQFQGMPIFILQGRKSAVEEMQAQSSILEEISKEEISKEEIIKRDDFTLISGIGEATATALFDNGIISFDDLINATPEQIMNIKIKSSWIEQAVVLKNKNKEV